MRSVERETGLLVGAKLIGVVGKGTHLMAPGARGPQFSQVDIAMARCTVPGSVTELERLVAAGAGGTQMGSLEPISQPLMIEPLRDASRSPSIGAVAIGTGNVEPSVGIYGAQLGRRGHGTRQAREEQKNQGGAVH
jgi:hypothetical protein